MENSIFNSIKNEDQERLYNYMSGISDHPVFTNNYFQHLKQNGFTPIIYELHRVNFYFRTMATVMGIAHICSHAALNHDKETLILFSYILNEECGNGEKSHCHEKLMEQAHNFFGQHEFGLDPIKVTDIKNGRYGKSKTLLTNLIIKESEDYRNKINELLNKSYPTMLGVAFALESHASHMLSNFREAFSKSRTKLNLDDYKDVVEVYFNCHLDSGVEDRHALDAKKCVLNNCISNESYHEITLGIEETLRVQSAMWDAMYANVLNLSNT